MKKVKFGYEVVWENTAENGEIEVPDDATEEEINYKIEDYILHTAINYWLDESEDE